MLRDAVIQAASRPDVRGAVARVYADLQSQIDARKPACSASGRCCRFEEYGHRMYVTTLELAAFVHDHVGESPAWDGTGCPYQVEGLCSVHSIRPFGCRVFFCDTSATQWQHDQYEHFHAQLRHLHDTLAVPYFYVEWRYALGELGLAGPSAPTRTEPDSATANPARLSLRQLPL